MRVDIKSKNKFTALVRTMCADSSIPIITGCSIDSKNINKGDAFFPLKGNRFDGHDFIKEAIQNGASLIIGDKNITLENNIPYIKVANVFNTIKKIAKSWRVKTGCEIIGITGSNGKTSTKEILNNVLSKSKSVMCSKSNYNSTIGLPMSIFSISTKDEVAVLEMGANKPGEIKELCDIAKPNHGLVTNISNAHNQYFGSIDDIAMNKITLLQSIPESGFGFINMDDYYLKKTSLSCKTITYGFAEGYDFNGELLDNTIKINNNIIRLPYSNMAIAQNYLAAYSISSTLGVNKSTIVAQLENTSIYPGRGKLIKKNGVLFIDDTYNSNFASCSNGIYSIVNMNAKKKILILGDMHELGDETKSEHVKLGQLINSLKIDAVFGLGEYIKYTLSMIKSSKIFKKHYNKKHELIKVLKKYCNNGDLVYVKGSRSMKMEEIIYNEDH